MYSGTIRNYCGSVSHVSHSEMFPIFFVFYATDASRRLGTRRRRRSATIYLICLMAAPLNLPFSTWHSGRHYTTMCRRRQETSDAADDRATSRLHRRDGQITVFLR